MEATLFFDEVEKKLHPESLDTLAPGSHNPSLGGLRSLFNMSGSVPIPEMAATLTWWVHRGTPKITITAISTGQSDAYFPPPVLTIPVARQIITCGLTTISPGRYVLVWLTVVPSSSSAENSASCFVAVSWLPVSLTEKGDCGLEIQANEAGCFTEDLPVKTSVTCAAIIGVSRDPTRFVTTVFVSDGFDIFTHDVSCEAMLESATSADEHVPLAVSKPELFAPSELAPYAGTKGGLANFLPWGRPTRSQQWVAMAPLGQSDGLALAHVSGKIVAVHGGTALSFSEVILPQGSFAHQMYISASGNPQTGFTVCTDAVMPGRHVVTAVSITHDSPARIACSLESPTPGSVPFGHAVLQNGTFAVSWLAEDVDERPVSISSMLHCARFTKTASLIQVCSPDSESAVQLMLSTSPRLDCILSLGDAFMLVETIGGHCRLYFAEVSSNSAGYLSSPVRAAVQEVLDVLPASCTSRETSPRDVLFSSSALVPFQPWGSSFSRQTGTLGIQPFLDGADVVSAASDGPEVLSQLIMETVKACADTASHHAYLELASTAQSNGHHCSRQPFTEEEVAAAIAVAMQGIQRRSLARIPSGVLSRRYIFEKVLTEISARLAFLIVTQVAVIFADPAATLQPYFRSLRAAIHLLTASVLAVRHIQNQLPLLLRHDDFELDTIVEKCVEIFVTPCALDNLGSHAVRVAAKMSGLSPNVQIPAKRVWGESLRERCPLASHLLIEVTVAAGRTNRSAHIEAYSSHVASHIAQDPLANSWIDLFASAFPHIVLHELQVLVSQHSDFAPRLYRSALLRQLVPKVGSKQVLVSSHTVESYFLPDLLFVLPRLSVEHTPNVHTMLSQLLLDVYLILARAAADSRQYALACRHAIAAKQQVHHQQDRPESKKLLEDIFSQVVDVAISSRHGQSLVQLPIEDPVVNTFVVARLVSRLTKGASAKTHGLSSSTAIAAIPDRIEITMLLLRFLSRRRAYGKAARIAYDVAKFTRDSGVNTVAQQQQDPQAVEQLLGLALHFLQNIPDVPPPDDEGDDDAVESKWNEGASADSWTSLRSSSSFDHNAVYSSIPKKLLPMSRADISLVSLRLVQARCERAIAAAGGIAHLVPWGDSLGDEKEKIRLGLVSTLQWALAEEWCVATGQSLAATFEAQVLYLLEKSETLAPQWESLVQRIMKHSNPENKFAPINIVVRSALRHSLSRKVPFVLKDALGACDPAGLIQALLSSKSQDDEARNSHDEALQTAYGYLLRRKRRDPSVEGIVVPISLLDRVALVAKKIVQNPRTDGLPVRVIAEKFLEAVVSSW
jgi:hypothetical protein